MNANLGGLEIDVITHKKRMGLKGGGTIGNIIGYVIWFVVAILFFLFLHIHALYIYIFIKVFNIYIYRYILRYI